MQNVKITQLFLSSYYLFLDEIGICPHTFEYSTNIICTYTHIHTQATLVTQYLIELLSTGLCCTH